MKNVILIAALVLASLLRISAQNELNQFVTESRTSKEFHFINIKGEMNVKIVQDQTPGVTVRGSNYQVKNTVTMLRNDTLFVYQTNTRKGDSKLNLMIKADNIDLIQVSGKTKVDCLGLINADNLNVKVKDGAQVKLMKESVKVESKIEG